MGAVSKCHLLAALFVILRRGRRISRKLEIEGTLSSIFPLKHRVTIVGFVPWRSLSMTFKWSSLSILSWNQSILNWRYRKEWIFMIFLFAIFEIFQIWTENARQERIPPIYSYLKHLQAIGLSLCNHYSIIKQLNNKTGETFCWKARRT